MGQNMDDFEEEKKRGAGRTKKNIYLVIALVCLVVAVVAIIYVVRYYGVLKQGDDAYASLQAEVESVVVPTPEPETVPEETTQEPTQEPVDPDENMNRVIDFDTLQAETNEDIYAWIYIPDTNVDYPVLQHPTDDTYYLNYNIDGTKGYPGCIYSEIENSKGFDDFNTVLYGHNMKNGSMFHDLHQYKDELFLEEHPNIYIYMPDKTLKYEIYAAYQYDDRHLLYSFDYGSEKGRQGYLDDILGIKSMSAVFNKDAEVTSDSHILTLSTCVGGQSTRRFLVQGVLLNDDINE